MHTGQSETNQRNDKGTLTFVSDRVYGIWSLDDMTTLSLTETKYFQVTINRRSSCVLHIKLFSLPSTIMQDSCFSDMHSE